jgi:hypothetical protein
LRVTREPPAVCPDGEGFGLWAADLGDGTVPAYCGLPVEMDRNSPRDLRVIDRHGAIASLDEIPELVQSFEGRPSELPARGDEPPAVLGLDLDEVALAGNTLELTARIAGTGSDISGVAV